MFRAHFSPEIVPTQNWPLCVFAHYIFNTTRLLKTKLVVQNSYRVIKGMLRKKPRILVTHQLHFLKEADEIIILKEVE